MYKEIKNNLTEQELYEMANLDKDLTGLPVNLWVDSSGQKRDTKYSAYRLKMQNNYHKLVDPNEMIPVSIDKTNPTTKHKINIKERDFNKVKRFITDNYEDLCLLVQNKNTDKELIHRLEDKQNNKDKVGV